MASDVVDPVCGMTVDPATAPARMSWQGRDFFFCCEHCRVKFEADPERFLKAPGSQPMSALTMTSAPPPGKKREYYCPMCPEVTSSQPGSCPKCGMALEAKDVSAAENEVSPDDREIWRSLWVSLLFGIPVIVLAMGPMLLGQSQHHHPAQIWLTIVVMLGGGIPIFRRAGQALRHGHTNMFTLIALGVLSAFAYSALTDPSFGVFSELAAGSHGPYYESIVSIIILVLVGQVLESKARHATTAAVRELASLTPKTARVLGPGGVEHDLPLELIQPGDTVRVRAGEKVPVDGVVLEGQSTIDESTLTGESVPVAKEPGAKVWTATLQMEGNLIVRVDKVSGETLLAQIVQRVQEAQRTRAPVQRLVDRVSAVFVPVVVLVSLVTFLGWWWLGGELGLVHGVLNAVAVLVIACPCALGLATPMAITVGVGRGAKQGILVRSAEALEQLERADTLVIDKTGTLTEGRPEVALIRPIAGFSEAEVLQMAASLERPSEHPYAFALGRAARKANLQLDEPNDFQSATGRGVRGTLRGKKLALGSPHWLQNLGIDTTELRDVCDQQSQAGMTMLLLACDGRVVAAFGLVDRVRSEAPTMVARLQREGVRIVMATGDHTATARRVAQSVGIDDVHAQQLPTDKQDLVRRLQGEGRQVAMAGDGVNDAPALAQAHVGIALGGGADVALETAGLALMKPDLHKIVEARELSRATLRTIWQNLLLAFGYNVLAIPLAAFGGLNPIIASLAMTLSSLSVVANSLRLMRTSSYRV